MVNTGKLPGITFSHLAMMQQPTHSTHSQMRKQRFNIRRCLYVCVCVILYSNVCHSFHSHTFVEQTDVHVFSCCGGQQKWKLFRFITFKLYRTSPSDSLTINSISNTMMAPAWHLNFVWQCCLCSIWTKRWGASVFMKEYNARVSLTSTLTSQAI